MICWQIIPIIFLLCGYELPRDMHFLTHNIKMNLFRTNTLTVREKPHY
jgi:hypothetical protein